MKNNFKHNNNQPIVRYYSPKSCYHWTHFLESPKSFPQQRTTDLPFEDQFAYWVHILGPVLQVKGIYNLSLLYCLPPPPRILFPNSFRCLCISFGLWTESCYGLSTNKFPVSLPLHINLSQEQLLTVAPSVECYWYSKVLPPAKR
jgi:hypothetical protein